MASTKRKTNRRIVPNEGRKLIARVYHFLKEEYEFTDQFREPYSDISHLRNITRRTAEAMGISERLVQKILREERETAGIFSTSLSEGKKFNSTKKKSIKSCKSSDDTDSDDLIN